MTLPGFTADASLYQGQGHYRTVSISGRASGIGEGVGLARIEAFCNPRQPDCYGDCMDRCDDISYYCDVNCSCCCKGGPPRCYYQ
jgi:hypothetical protein